MVKVFCVFLFFYLNFINFIKYQLILNRLTNHGILTPDGTCPSHLAKAKVNFEVSYSVLAAAKIQSFEGQQPL